MKCRRSCAAALVALVCVVAPAMGGLTAYYPFDADLADAAGDNDGAGQNGASITTAAGEFTQGAGALKLVRTSSQYVKLDGLSNDLATGDAFSLTGWFRTSYSPPGDNQHQLFSAHTSTGGNVFRLGTDTGGGLFLTRGSPDQRTGSGYNDDGWHFVAVTETGSGVPTVKVDNVELTGFRTFVTPWSTATQYSIGQEYDGGSAGDFWNGFVDDVAIWNQVLPDAHITALYKGASPLFVGTVSFQQGVDHGNGVYAGAQDTYLEEAQPTTNRGGHTQIWVDGPGDGQRKDGLLCFDDIFGNAQGQIPLGASILSAELTLTTPNIASAEGNGALMHRVLIPWTDAATWNSSFGADGIDPDDIEALAAYDVDTGPMTATLPFSATFDVMASLQAWSDGDPNYGWALLSKGDNGWAPASSNFGTLDSRPMLTVTYLYPEPTSLALLGIGAVALLRRRRR